MHTFFKRFRAGMVVFPALFCNPLVAQFSQGNIVVLQAGDGSATLSSSATAIFLQEYTPVGVPAFSMAIPTSTSGSNALVLSGSAISEGLMTRSADRHYLVFAGYYSLVGTATIASTSGTTAPRSIGKTDAAGNYSLAASHTSFYSGNSIRSAVSDGLDNYWAGGTPNGTTYFGTTAPATLVQNSVSNVRATAICNNQLYVSTGSAPRGIYAVGSGTPLSSAATASVIATGSGSSPYQFCFNPSATICYVADDGTTANGGGVQKWIYASSAWSLAYTYTFSSNPRGLIADFSGVHPIVYITTGETSANRLVAITDGGSVVTSTVTVLATAAANRGFRGLAFSPESLCPTPVISSVSAAPVCAGQPLLLQASASGTGSLSYAWNGAGSFSLNSISNPTVMGAASGNYTVTVTNACGSSSAVIAATVNPLPAISTSSAVICSGNTATLTAGGASTYTWNPGGSTMSIVTSPSATSVYSVSATSSAGCVSSATTQVLVNANPTVTVNSATVCPGTSATLTASGAASYSWSTSSGSSISVSPATSTTYTVSGSLSGCTGSALATVSVNASPSLTVPAITLCSGGSGTLTAAGASSYTWNTGATTHTISDAPATTTQYTVSGTSAQGCVSTGTSAIIVTSSPGISVNSATICTGSSATLTATGVQTYTWSTASTGNSIVAMPTSAAVYTVSGHAPGCPAPVSATAAVMVNAQPAITVTPITICAGSSGTVTAGGASTYSWNTGAGTSSIVVSPPATTVYTVTGTSSTGCTSAATTTILVNSAPVITVNSSTVCAGRTATLSASGVSSYTWNNSAHTSSLAFAPSATAVYTVSGNASGCATTASATATVVVNPNPTLAVNAATICSGNTATLTASGAGSYSWSTTAATASIPVSPIATTVYSVTGTSSLNCITTVTTQVLVKPSPSLAVSSATVCAGSSAALTASGASSYSWNTSATGSAITVTPASTAVYTVTGSAAGCIASTTGTVLVNALPVISVPSLTVCSGNIGTLTATGANTYTWSTSAVSPSIPVSPSVTMSYTVTGTSTANCITTATVQVNVSQAPLLAVSSATICSGSGAMLMASGAASYTWNTSDTTPTIIVAPAVTTGYTVTGAASGCTGTANATLTVLSTPTITVNSVSVCAGSSATLIASGAASYLWSNGATADSLAIAPVSTGIYTVSGSASGCYAASQTATVTVYALPPVSIGSLPDGYCINEAPLLLSGTPAGGIFSGTGISGSAFTPSATGMFVLHYSYTDANLCSASDSKTVTVDLCTGIENKQAITALSVFPDPASDRLFIRYEGHAEPYTVEIAAAGGDQCFSMSSLKSVHGVDISQLPKGIYFIRIRSDAGTLTRKFIRD